jgi:hypothetical protein
MGECNLHRTLGEICEKGEAGAIYTPWGDVAVESTPLALYALTVATNLQTGDRQPG